MEKQTRFARIILSLTLAGLLLFAFMSSNLVPAHALPRQTGCTTWDVTTDFRASPNHENPNRDSCGTLGVWEFMGSSGLSRVPANYYKLPNFTANAAGITGLNQWQGTRVDTLAVVGYNASGASRTVGSSVWPANTVAVHPAPDQLAIVAWHSPVTAYISISGGVYDMDSGGGAGSNGIEWYIEKNSSNIASGSYNNGGSQTFSAGTNGSSLSSVAVNVGDVIYVVVHPKGTNHTYDSTRVDISISTTASATPTPSSSPCTLWDVTTDFRISPNQENPNRDSCGTLGVWEFMGSSSLTRAPATYYKMGTFTASGGGISGLNQWKGTASGGLPLVGYNATGSTQTVGTSTWPDATIGTHPASNQLAIIAWHSPINGYVSVSGDVADFDANGGDGIQWYIDKNSTNLAYGSYANGGSQTFASGTNGANLNTVAVSIGDVLYLVIHPNANHSYDSTGVTLSIDVTSAPTPTATVTNTPTITFTPTVTFTPTPITPTPRSEGQGTCWESDQAWPVYSAAYRIDESIPSSWIASIDDAADTWTNVTPSPFIFVNSSQSPHSISLGEVAEEGVPVYTRTLSVGIHITDVDTIFNDDRDFDISIPPAPSNFSVQNEMTHEFGHWLVLDDLNATCAYATMGGGTYEGNIDDITLDAVDEEGINWQYP